MPSAKGCGSRLWDQVPEKDWYLVQLTSWDWFAQCFPWVSFSINGKVISRSVAYARPWAAWGNLLATDLLNFTRCQKWATPCVGCFPVGQCNIAYRPKGVIEMCEFVSFVFDFVKLGITVNIKQYTIRIYILSLHFSFMYEVFLTILLTLWRSLLVYVQEPRCKTCKWFIIMRQMTVILKF